MLRWIVETNISSAVLKDPKMLINEEDVEVQPERIPYSAIDENVDIHLIRKYFTNDAWLLVVDVIDQKRLNPVYMCNSCSHDLNESPSIMCDHCLSWFHIQCMGLKQNPKARYWYCRDCHKSPLV